MENLTRLREVIIAQQTALSEQRARLARGSHLEDDYRGLSDDYKGGGFAGGDSKKRRGVSRPGLSSCFLADLVSESRSSRPVSQLQSCRDP